MVSAIECDHSRKTTRRLRIYENGRPIGWRDVLNRCKKNSRFYCALSDRYCQSEN